MSTSRMPREQRRTQLLELATRVFTQKGFRATSMDDIAGAAGVTKPVLYQHFDSKETLYIEVIDITARNLLEGVRDIGEIQATTTDRVRHGLERFYQLVTSDNALRLFTGHEVISEQVQHRVSAVLDDMAVELARVLMVSRRLSTEQARIVGRALIAMTQTTAMLLHETAEESERTDILETMTTLAVRGLTGFEPLKNPGVSGAVLAGDGSTRSGADG